MHRSRSSALALVGLLALGVTGCAGASAPEGSSVPSASTSAAATGVTAISPATGNLTGGTKLTITGSGLAAVTGMMVGKLPATKVTVVDDNTVTAISPIAQDYVAGDVDVTALVGETVVPGTASFSYAEISGADRQLAYAFKYWENYNTAEWGNMNSIGGDCANFTSQSLIARGWKMTDAWRSEGANAVSSEAWRYSPTMDAWFKSGADGHDVTPLSLEQRDQLKPGDIGFFDWDNNGNADHVMFVSKVEVVDGKTQVKFVSHNLDGQYRDLDETITTLHPGATAWFYGLGD